MKDWISLYVEILRAVIVIVQQGMIEESKSRFLIGQLPFNMCSIWLKLSHCQSLILPFSFGQFDVKYFYPGQSIRCWCGVFLSLAIISSKYKLWANNSYYSVPRDHWIKDSHYYRIIWYMIPTELSAACNLHAAQNNKISMHNAACVALLPRSFQNIFDDAWF